MAIPRDNWKTGAFQNRLSLSSFDLASDLAFFDLDHDTLKQHSLVQLTIKANLFQHTL
jgi:hypothetical protein